MARDWNERLVGLAVVGMRLASVGQEKGGRRK